MENGHTMLTALSSWAWLQNAAALCLMAFFAWRLTNIPTARTRKKIVLALQAKGMTLVEVEPQWELRRRSGVLLVARAKDVFGNDTNQYFRVDALAEVLGLNASVRESYSPKSPMRAFNRE